MPNKTIYIRDERIATWERAKRISELMQSNISFVIMEHLQAYCAENEATAQEIERLTSGVLRAAK